MRCGGSARGIQGGGGEGNEGLWKYEVINERRVLAGAFI